MMKVRNFQLPKKMVTDESVTNDRYGKFIAEPFERGYGHTIGNSLRRIVLSSLEGAAVTGVRIKGVSHEFSTIPGVREDVTDIVLNMKGIRFKLFSEGPETLYLNLEKKGEVSAADIEVNSNIEILNSEHHICTLDKNIKLDIEIEVSRGRGYLPAEREIRAPQQVGKIMVDAIFTPVLKVNYSVENARVGQSIDYDRLIFEIWTDGSVKPADALAYGAKILKDSLSIFINFDETPLMITEEVVLVDEKAEALKHLIDLPVNIIELTVRSINCLNRAEIKTIGDLIKQTEDKLLSFKNFGKKSLNEIKEKLYELGQTKGVELKLGMEIPAPAKGEHKASERRT